MQFLLGLRERRCDVLYHLVVERQLLLGLVVFALQANLVVDVHHAIEHIFAILLVGGFEFHIHTVAFLRRIVNVEQVCETRGCQFGSAGIDFDVAVVGDVVVLRFQ